MIYNYHSFVIHFDCCHLDLVDMYETSDCFLRRFLKHSKGLRCCPCNGIIKLSNFFCNLSILASMVFISSLLAAGCEAPSPWLEQVGRVPIQPTRPFCRGPIFVLWYQSLGVLDHGNDKFCCFRIYWIAWLGICCWSCGEFVSSAWRREAWWMNISSMEATGSIYCKWLWFVWFSWWICFCAVEICASTGWCSYAQSGGIRVSATG